MAFSDLGDDATQFHHLGECSPYSDLDRRDGPVTNRTGAGGGLSTTGGRGLLAAQAWRLLKDVTEDLPPSYFSLVMATGIVAIAAQFGGMARIASLLFLVGLVAFVLLWVLTVLKIILYPRRLLADLKQHAVSPGYFTSVAGTCVIGIGIVRLTNKTDFALWLWMFALMVWLLVTYAVFTTSMVSPCKPSLRRGLNGMWLTAAVATQGVSVLGTLVASHFGVQRDTILLVTMSLYLTGCMLYVNLMAMIFYRLIFVPVAPIELTPPYWITMGATAIATQAGATLIGEGRDSSLLVEFTPYLKGFTLFFWAAGTWWLPLLIGLSIWRHAVMRVSIRYDPQWWAAVFPIGMYTVSTYQAGDALRLESLLAIPKATIYLALAAWSWTFAGLLCHLGKSLVAPAPDRPAGAIESTGP
jgi:tellurite resistance protein TehA-like permease